MVDFMKALVIYYSFEGNSKLIAEAIKDELHCDSLELHMKKELKGKGFIKYLWGGKQVVLKQKPELLPYNKDFSQYDTIIFGSPVWAGTFSPAFSTFFNDNNISNKKILLYATFAGNEGRIFKEFQDKLSGNEFIGEKGFKDPLENEKEKNIQDAKTWVRKYLS